MDDFLYNLRSGKTGNFDRNRRLYSNNQNRGGKDFKKPGADVSQAVEQLTNLMGEILPAIKTLLENIDESNKQLAANGLLLVKAEERKAAAMEKFASFFKLANPDFKLATPDDQPFEPASPDDKTAAGAEPPSKMPESQRHEVLQMISDMRDQNMSFNQIALQLEEKGVKTLSGRGKWSGQMVHRFIQNP